MRGCLQEKVFEKFLKIRGLNCGADSIEKINDKAKFYLLKETSRDLSAFKGILEEGRVKGLIREDDFLICHISWIISFLRDLTQLREKPSYEFEFAKCRLVETISQKKHTLIGNKLLPEDIEVSYRLLYLFAEKIYSAVKDRNFINAWLAYKRFIKNAFSLFALLSFLRIKTFEEEIKVDPLTGLLNRRYLFPILKNVLKLSFYTETPFAIALMDIDDFKGINDRYGHLIGDCILKKVAKFIKNSLRKSDYIFRYGGDEILMLIPSPDREESYKILERLRKKIEDETFVCMEKAIKITVSIGVCNYVHDGKRSPEEYISCADKKLYMAKSQGKNKVVI